MRRVALDRGPRFSRPMSAPPQAIGAGADVTDYWSDGTGCWADVWEDDFEDAPACNAPPAPGSALGLCPEHDARSWRLRGDRRILLGLPDSFRVPSSG
jgi:hypothetical protein